MKRIMVVGCGGSGKSTLTKELGKVLDIPIYHLDYYYWLPGWVPTPKQEWDEFVIELAAKPAWIIDGNFNRTMNLRLDKADTVIFLDYSRWSCLYGVIKRRLLYHGKTRPDLNEGCPEKLDWQFIRWVWKFENEQAPIIRAKFNRIEGKQIYHFRNRKQLQNWFNNLS